MSITEQLKGKECKSVIGILITAKSRLLKKWKIIDTGFAFLRIYSLPLEF